jgi:hypothetical protein
MFWPASLSKILIFASTCRLDPDIRTAKLAAACNLVLGLLESLFIIDKSHNKDGNFPLTSLCISKTARSFGRLRSTWFHAAAVPHCTKEAKPLKKLFRYVCLQSRPVDRSWMLQSSAFRHRTTADL